MATPTRKYGTTTADLSSHDSSAPPMTLGQRNQDILQDAFPRSPIHSERYLVDNPEGTNADEGFPDGNYILYEALLNNAIKGGEIAYGPIGSVVRAGPGGILESPPTEANLLDLKYEPPEDSPKTEAKVHWGFDTAAKTSLVFDWPGYRLKEGHNDPKGLHHQFCPNLRPPTEQEINNSDTSGDASNSAPPPDFGRDITFKTPHETSTRVPRNDKPVLRTDGKIRDL